MRKPEQTEQQPIPNQELEQLKKELKEKGYVVKKTSARWQKIDITIENSTGQEGSGEGYTQEMALNGAIKALDYIIKNQL